MSAESQRVVKRIKKHRAEMDAAAQRELERRLEEARRRDDAKRNEK